MENQRSQTEVTSRASVGGLLIHRDLYDLVENEIAPGTGVESEQIWQSLAEIVQQLGPRNEELLRRRDELQQQLDAWFAARQGSPLDPNEQREFLRQIGYLVEPQEDFTIATENVDREIAEMAGPQLVVPVNNSRYALNAANARWGSLYDALYGTDVLGALDANAAQGYDPNRGELVFRRSHEFLDEHFPFSKSWNDIIEIVLQGDAQFRSLQLLTSLGTHELAEPEQFVGYVEREGTLTHVLLKHHGLHVELQIDREHPIGKQHSAGIKDIVLEAAITTIQDCEDSVAAVDGEDKTLVYRNWLGLMKGDLEATFQKGGDSLKRRLEPDRTYVTPDGDSLNLPGRSLLLVRNVGMHMQTDAVMTSDGQPVPEAFVDAMITSLAALHDIHQIGQHRNSRTGSVYIVKPKQHGPDEISLTMELFARVEQALSLPENTLKIGIMDEERRTTLNLKECIRRARRRVVFINTGFLDRTGDEIHTLMHAGPFVPKPEIKHAEWLAAYEDHNVDTGLSAGFQGRAQIGKGMWAMPDRMAAMLESKGGHPNAGANTAWVPSPTAAVLHAIHYHQVDVSRRQRELADRHVDSMPGLLTPSLMSDRNLSGAEIQQELDNNAQGILGYVVRWIDQGIGCSKVPDVNDIGLMEDRATLRISSQHIANWLLHNVTTKAQVVETFQRMAQVVDQQNAEDPSYECMAQDFDGSLAFQAALALVLEGRDEPNGYTERLLTDFRRRKKATV